MAWNVADISVGDYMEVRVSNPHGDRNLDGAIIFGIVKELVPSHKMVLLDTGWCLHTKDELLAHHRTCGCHGEVA